MALFGEEFAFLLLRDHPILASRNRSGDIAPPELAALPRLVLVYPDGTKMVVGRSASALWTSARTWCSTDSSLPVCAFIRERLGPGPVRAQALADLVAVPSDLAILEFPEADPVT
jgi:hypothetical protein